ncbi:MAG: hypothetical protein M1151_03465 [Candidatus Thermoplasmatota archaeon]|nr:hypothetical protein [Candidatus Thermoplasmatota archaeon]MCL5785714.1 hypothetical protein [Candidatus Thermoplasmatota archaeon]
MRRNDKTVSEIVGTMLVFAIVVSAFSAFEMWYVPATDTAYEQQFQKSSQAAMVSLISQLDSPYLATGSTISQDFPLGIQGSVLSPAEQSSLSFTHSGFNASLTYSANVNYKLLENTVPTAIQNEVNGTIPEMNGVGPTQSVTLPNGMTYITDFGSNSMEVINSTAHRVLGNFQVGIHPAGIAVGRQLSGSAWLLYISNFFNYTASDGTSQYSTITVFDTGTNTVVQTINSKAGDTHYLFPSGLAYRPYNSTGGYLYVSVLRYTTGTYGSGWWPWILVMNTSGDKLVGEFEYNSSRLSTYSGNLGNLSINNLVIFDNISLAGSYEVWGTDYWQNQTTAIQFTSDNVLYQNQSNSHVRDLNTPRPYGIAYDNVSNAVYVTNSTGLLTLSGTPNGGGFEVSKASSHGQIIAYSASTFGLVTGSITLPGPVTSSFNNGVIPVNVSAPDAIAVIQHNLEDSTIYVAGYNVLFNSTGDFSYSPIIAVDFSKINGYSTDQPASFNYPPNATIKYMQGPDSLSTNAGSLVASDNLTEDTIFLQSGSGLIDMVWNNPFTTPVSVAYLDNGTFQYYLAMVDAGSSSVVLFDTINNSVVKSFDVGSQPTCVAYDPANGYLYVTNNLTDNVTIIDPNLNDTSHGHNVANVNLSRSFTNLSANANPSFAVYDPHNESMYVLDNGTGNVTQIIQQAGSNVFLTKTFSINPPNVTYAAIDAWVKGPVKFGQDQKNGQGLNNTLDNNGSERFYLPSGSNFSINGVSLRLYGSGNVVVGLGTGNLNSINWTNEAQGHLSSLNISHPPNGIWVQVLFNGNVTLSGGKSYFINVKASPGLYWLWTLRSTNTIQQEGDTQDYHYFNGLWYSDNSTPFGFKIGHLNSGSSGSSPIPYPSSAVISPTVNNMYMTFYGGDNVTEVNLSNYATGAIRSYPAGLMPRDIAYDQFDNNMYVANSGSHFVSVINAVNSSIAWTFGVGMRAFPMAIGMDTGNGYVYIGNNASNNVTLENTFTSQTLNNIATGMGPTGLAYDPNNGLIYVLDSGTNQVTMINGGSTYYNGHIGFPKKGVYYGSGEISSYGYTPFVNQMGFYMQDALVLTNYSSSKYAISSADVPVSVINSSGKIYLSSFLMNLEGPETSVSGSGASTLLLNVTQFSKNLMFQGQQFTYYDLYGNGYPAMVTNISLSYFSYKITSDYSSEIDKLMYDQSNGSSNGNLSLWNFTGYPFQVSLSGDVLTIYSTGAMPLYSSAMTYSSLTVVKI